MDIDTDTDTDTDMDIYTHAHMHTRTDLTEPEQRYDTLQYIATHCNTLQHITTQ